MAAEQEPTSNTVDRDPHRIAAALRPHLRIAHQIGGRVRLKLALAAVDTSVLSTRRGAGLLRAFGALPGVRAIKVNAMALSCVVEYDTTVIPDAAWPDLLAGRGTAAADTLLALLASVAPTYFQSSEEESS